MSSQYISHLGLGNNFPPLSLLGHQAAGDVHVPSGVHTALVRLPSQQVRVLLL